ncbi:ISAs1 family transposase [Endozoicomonas sp. ALE010]|uniref:ISAs1 family transposase n=1 Tax=Endozoicomonas sp. ALE010 TaxID=3403081 RepID=UPI003BB6E01E
MNSYAPIIDRLHQLAEPRDKVHVVYPLQEVLFIVYASILSGYTEWQSMASFAHYNKAWFRQFFPYKYGFPSHHTIEKVCMMVDSVAFMQLFIDWMCDTVTAINARKVGPPPEKNDNVVAIDGKALRGSRPAKGKKMVHIVSAYCSELNLILGITSVDKKSNEITAIPEILDMLVLEGALITMDAMGCQVAICKKIVEKKADYLICVKNNQPTLHNRIDTVFEQYIEENPTDPDPDDEENPFFAETIEKSRNRQEHRRSWVFNNIKSLVDPGNEWPGLEHCAIIQRDRLIDSRQSTELNFYITSREMTAKSVLAAARNHWSTENKQHWELDVSFSEDASKIHERTATKNIATLRRCCYNAHKQSTHFEKESMCRRAELAGLDEDYRTELILEQFSPG